jgi:transketolase
MHILSERELEALTLKAEEIRESIIMMLLEAKSGHTAGPLGMADIFTMLYFKILNHDPKNPLWNNRDRVILSNGHIVPVQYATLAHAGYFGKAELKTLRKFGSRLQGHPHRTSLPGIETTSGPLGCGLSQAIGMAFADKLSEHKSPRYFYTLLSDGELNEGQNWESLLLLGREKFTNIITIIDRNKIQIDGFTENVLPLESLSAKFAAFNLQVIEINGHDMMEFYTAVSKAKQTLDMPTVIIAHTIPGKGVHEFEGDYHWHGKAPSDKEAELALKELRSFKNTLTHTYD